MHISLFAFVSSFAVAGLHLVERRGRGEKLNPGRQIEISTLLDSMPEAVFLFDSQAKVIDLNATAQEITGVQRARALQFDAHSLTKHFGADGNSIDFPETAVGDALRGRTARGLRRGFRDPKDGHTVEALISATPMRANGGEIVGALVIVRDITEMAQLHRRLADTQKHYAVGQMAAGIVHDFNNVLDAINQAVYILQTGANKPSEERQTYLKMIERAVRRGAEISQRVREYLKSGNPQATSVDLKAILEDSIELTRPLWSQSPNLRVTWQIHEMPCVCGDSSDLRRVFTNLIINALEAMPQGGKLNVRAEKNENCARVYISDTGQGIKPEHKKRIFSQYFTTKREGTGLGLSGAYRTITAAKGKLTFSSEVGKGTTFCVELPLADGMRGGGDGSGDKRIVKFPRGQENKADEPGADSARKQSRKKDAA
jgi:PAS domain S-box-containing protein